MADSINVKVEGLDGLKVELTEISRTLRKKVLLKALKAAAKIVLQEARSRVPVLSDQLPNAYRTKGLLKKRLTIRTSRVSRQEGNIGVFVNVKPADGAKYKTVVTNVLGFKFRNTKMTRASRRGAKSPDDPFYWWFVERGTRPHLIKPRIGKKALSIGISGAYSSVNHPGARATPFLRPASEKLPEALKAFEAEVIPAIEAFNKKGQR